MKKILAVLLFNWMFLGLLSAQKIETTINHKDGTRTEVKSTGDGHVVEHIGRDGHRESGGSAGPGDNHKDDHRREVEHHMKDDSKVGRTNDKDIKPGMDKDKVRDVNDKKDKPKG